MAARTTGTGIGGGDALAIAGYLVALGFTAYAFSVLSSRIQERISTYGGR